MAKIRSRAYPSLDLGTAIKKLDIFAGNLSRGFYSREEATLGLGYKGMSGASARAVAALVQYGLLERRKDSYGLSSLGQSIIYNTSEESRAEAIELALLKPTLFRELIEQYKGQKLPEVKFLSNMLTMPKYGISPRQKDEVADIFLTSLRFVGHLENDTIPEDSFSEDLTNLEVTSTAAKTQVPGGLKSNEKTQSATASVVQAPLLNSLRELPSGIKISFPTSLDYAVMTGEFGDEIKKLELKAQTVLTKNKPRMGSPKDEKDE